MNMVEALGGVKDTNLFAGILISCCVISTICLIIIVFRG